MATQHGTPLADSSVSETTPLLAVSEAGPTTHANDEAANGYANGHTALKQPRNDSDWETPPIHRGEEDVPLPKLQIFLLCYCSLVEPIAYFSIFPFINQMIKETGSVEEEDVGFWSGMIESLFSLVQMLLMIFYGRMADSIGRKPVLIFSLTGIAIATSLFGTSQKLWQMIAFRCASGLFAGSVVTVRAMITENCTANTQARAFSFYAFTRNLGIFLGPLIGGALAKPAEQYPEIFGGSQFLINYPYALPTFFTGAVAASAMLVSLFLLKETLNRKADTTSGVKNREMSTWEIIRAPGVLPVLYIFTHVMLLGLAFTAVIPVFFFTQVALGGFGFSIQQISLLLAVGGASQALWILIAFPPLQRRFSTGWVIRACAYAWPIFFALFPIGNEFLRRGWKVGFWILVPINMIGGSGVSMAFTCVQLALNDISPSPTTLGTLNALALTLNSAIRAVAPAFFASIFATGIRLRWLDGHLVWILLVLLGLGLCVAVRWLPKQAEGKIRKNDDEED